jgi:diguanylate cyclase (GGDEF)-like protein
MFHAPVSDAAKLQEALFSRAQDLLLVLGTDLTLRICNRAFATFIGDGVDPQNRSLLEVVDEKSQARLRTAVATAQSGAAPGVELAHKTTHGLRLVNYTFFPLDDGSGLIGAVGRDKSADLGLIERNMELNRRYDEKVLELAMLTGKLREMATTDSLTGLFNRWAFLERAGAEWGRHMRYSHHLSCVMIDVDHFKQVNDRHGHQAGDEVLRVVGALLRTGLRASDLPARLGGEEFVALLPETPLDGAVILGDRLRMRIAGRTISAGTSQLRVTVSAGVACATGQYESLERLLGAADAAMYRAKREGRDCLRTAT